MFVFPFFVEKGIGSVFSRQKSSDISHNLEDQLFAVSSQLALVEVFSSCFNVSSSDFQCHTSSRRTWHPSWSLFCPCCPIWASRFDRCVLLFCLKYSLKLILPYRVRRIHNFFFRFEANLIKYRSDSLHIYMFWCIHKQHFFASSASYSLQNIRTDSLTNIRLKCKKYMLQRIFVSVRIFA